MAGLLSAAAGGAVLSAGAFTSSVAAEADMRVVVSSELRLVAAREGGDYVDAEELGGPVNEIIVESLNLSARSEFAGIVRIVNDSDATAEEFRFEFDSDREDVVDTLGILSEEGIEEDDGTFVLTPEGGLGPGEDLDFGVSVDLLPEEGTEPPDLSEGVEVGLEITAEG